MKMESNTRWKPRYQQRNEIVNMYINIINFSQFLNDYKNSWLFKTKKKQLQGIVGVQQVGLVQS